jgi:hypothetical protein
MAKLGSKQRENLKQWPNHCPKCGAHSDYLSFDSNMELLSEKVLKILRRCCNCNKTWYEVYERIGVRGSDYRN